MSWVDANKLFEIVEKLQGQADEQAAKSAILITLNELNTFALRHFAEEERFLSCMRSMEFKSRHRLHQHLLQQLANHTEDFKEAPTPKISSEFFQFLNCWVQLHSQTLKAMPEGWDPN